MKKVLITGKNSYIGLSLENWLLKEIDSYQVDTLDMRDEAWKSHDFSSYDTVFHVAGIAHIKETSQNRELYYKVNRDLAYETAKLAKKSGVKQFIFLSSMSVYGIETGIIDKNTLPKPKNAYGKSKLEAEKLIRPLEDDSFSVAILRPPMVYGSGCKGNYARLSSLAKKVSIFPDIQNQRSMIYIDNLSEFVKLLIDCKCEGLFFPQNTEYVCTSEMVRLIAEASGKKIKKTKFFNPVLKLLSLNTVNKVFGDLLYESSMSKPDTDYRVVRFEESIEKTEVEAINIE